MKNGITWACLLIVSLLALSCGDNGLSGKTIYVLDGRIDHSTYYSSLKEFQLHFISNGKVEARMTMYADALGYRIIPDSSKEAESKILSYSYESGVLSLPTFNLTSKLNFLEDGSIVTDENEYMYGTSIVNLLGTDEAYERLKQNSKGNFAVLFKSYIEKPYKPLLRKQNGMLILNETAQEDNKKSSYDDLQNQFNDALVLLDSLTGNGFLMTGEQTKSIADLRDQIRNEFRGERSNLNSLRILIQKFDSRVKGLQNDK